MTISSKNYRRQNGGIETILLVGGLGIAAYFIYEYMLAASAVTVSTPTVTTTNTTIATQTNAATQYAISAADIQSIYTIAVNQLGVTGGLTQWGTWAQAYSLYRGFAPPASAALSASSAITASEFANWVNNWVNNQGLSGLGTIGRNFGPPAHTFRTASRYAIINAIGR